MSPVRLIRAKTMKRREHGGNPGELEQLYGCPEDGWLDLSTGINPLPYPVSETALKNWGPLPLESDVATLRQAAATCYGLNDPALVVPAPGTQALIQWLPRLRRSSQVSIVSPTYNEHAHCWRTAGHDVREVSDITKVSENDDVVIVVNPNNPDGREHQANDLFSLARSLAGKGGWLVVDEAFCDVTPHLSLGDKVGEPGLVLLRSFGKFYGLAGLRLGFALTDTVLSERLTTFLGPWAVSAPAISLGIQALQDKDWQDNTRQWLEQSAARMDVLISQAGFDVLGGTALFRLIDSENAEALYHHLARRGILSRKFQYEPHWLRLGLPGREEDWEKLEVALADFSNTEAFVNLTP